MCSRSCTRSTVLALVTSIPTMKPRIRSADKVIFPGVGEASTTMSYLRNVGLDKVIPSLKQPVFGTCVGMQLMCRFSEENNTECMGIFDVDVKRFPATAGLKVPHMGWNNITGYQSPLTAGLPDNAYVYFRTQLCGTGLRIHCRQLRLRIAIQRDAA